MNTCIYIHICLSVFLSLSLYIYTYVTTYAHVDIHIYIHIYICTSRLRQPSLAIPFAILAPASLQHGRPMAPKMPYARSRAGSQPLRAGERDHGHKVHVADSIE